MKSQPKTYLETLDQQANQFEITLESGEIVRSGMFSYYHFCESDQFASWSEKVDLKEVKSVRLVCHGLEHSVSQGALKAKPLYTVRKEWTIGKFLDFVKDQSKEISEMIGQLELNERIKRKLIANYLATKGASG